MMADAIFNGKTALLYGGGKGIGRAVALEFSRRGARLAIADLDLDAAQQSADLAGRDAIALHCNVLSDDSVRAAADAAEATLGPIDIVMNNVGGMLNGHPEDVPFAEWQRMMDLNYFAAVRSLTYFMPKMIARGSGHIINTASFAGLYPYAASRIPYAAAKAAVIAMTESLAIYLKPLGVNVSCLIPGPVMTGVLDSMTSWTPDAPMRGPGSQLELKLPEEVAITLADGIVAGKVLIPSDETVWKIVQDWADDPEGFIQSKIDAFARGDSGRPVVPEALQQKLAER